MEGFAIDPSAGNARPIADPPAFQERSSVVWVDGSMVVRDALGFSELWREGDATAALSLPGTDVQLMLDATDPDAPFLVVDSVEAFHATRPETLTVIEEVSEIPGGFMATYQDPGGATIYVLDQSTDATTD